jgi:AcrR family transcriptional regulator
VDDHQRPYRSPLRADQARATRRRIVHAGRDLFVERGYRGTTIDAIAARAEVSRKTVFTSVGGKPGLLKLAWDWALVGDDEPVAMRERPEVQRMMAEPDTATFLAEWSRSTAVIMSRIAPMAEVLAVAADGDPEVAALRSSSEDDRRSGAQVCVEHLAELGALRAGMDITRATAIVATFMDPMTYRRLVVDAGWTLDEFADFLETLVTATVR